MQANTLLWWRLSNQTEYTPTRVRQRQMHTDLLMLILDRHCHTAPAPSAAVPESLLLLLCTLVIAHAAQLLLTALVHHLVHLTHRDTHNLCLLQRTSAESQCSSDAQ
jgi:hypothetical protein